MQRKAKEETKISTPKLNDLQIELLDYVDFLKQQMPSQFTVSSKENTIKTGFLLYDEIIGGIPLGKYILISSQEGQGKTTLMVQLQAVLQKQAYKTMYLDTESSMSERRMKELGMDINNTIYLVPDCLEDQYKLMWETMKKKEVLEDKSPFVFCFDSNTQTPIRQELEDDDLTDKQPGQIAKINSLQLKKIIKPLQRTNCTLIMISQLRDKINMGFGQSFGPKDTTTGGKQMKFYAHQDIVLQSKSDDVMQKMEIDGKVVSIKQKKNRIASPNVEFFMQLDFKNGFSDSISNFLYLSNLKDQDWKEQNFEYIPFKSVGGWYELKYEDKFTKKFRSKEFPQLYDSEPEFKDQVRDIITKHIRTIHGNIITNHEEDIEQEFDDVEELIPSKEPIIEQANSEEGQVKFN